MPSNLQNPLPPLFMGEFRHAIDGKGRITIPSDWRIAEGAEFFIIPSSSASCLKVMPRQEIERIRAQAAALPGPQRIDVLRTLGSGTRQCRLDKAGRLVVPPEFCRQVAISGEVILAGAIETFEIWNANAWEKARNGRVAAATSHLSQFGL